MRYYKLHVDGKIEMILTDYACFDDLEINGYANVIDGNDHFLLMDEANDDVFRDKLTEDAEDVNKALQAVVKNSVFVGDMLLVKLDEDDILHDCEDPSLVLRNLEYKDGRLGVMDVEEVEHQTWRGKTS